MNKAQRVKREKAGRPEAVIDWLLAAKLLQAGCKAIEVAAHFAIDKQTMYNRCKSDNNCEFSTFYRQNKTKGDALIKTKLFERAMTSQNPATLIFLAKNRLGMTDRPAEDKPENLRIEVVTVSKPDEVN